MSKLEDSLSLMDRLEAIDKRKQERIAKLKQEFQNNKPSRNYIKRKAIELLNNNIIQCNCNYHIFYYMMNGAAWLYFTKEEWLEIDSIVIRILQSESEFDRYCREQDLK